MSACQWWEHGFNPWSGKISHAGGQLSLVLQLLSSCSRVCALQQESTHTYAHKCTHTHTHTSVQIFLGFERTLVATLIKSYLIPRENGQLGFIVQMAALLRLPIPIPNHTFQCQCEKWQITGYQWFPSPLNSSSVHTHTHTSVQINLGFERILAAPWIKSNPIPHEEG